MDICEVCGGHAFATVNDKVVCERHSNNERLRREYVPLAMVDHKDIKNPYQSEELSDENQDLVDTVRNNLFMLTPTQRQILHLSTEGLSVMEIARKLAIDHASVSRQLKAIQKKFKKLTTFKER